MVDESSHDRVIGEDVGKSEHRKQAPRVVDVAVGGEAEDFAERERVGGVRESWMDENTGVDLIENSHVRTFLDQKCQSFFFVFRQLCCFRISALNKFC